MDLEGKGSARGRFRGEEVAIDINIKPATDAANLRSAERCRPSLAQDSTIAAFLTDTSIHGVKYIAQENRHWCERLFWLLAFILGISSSAYLIHGMWDRYYHTPVIVTFDAHAVPTSSIPFPAVTICSNNLVSRRLINGLKRTLDETNSSDPKHIEAERTLGFARYLCREKSEGSHHNGKQVDDMIAFFLNSTDPCDEMIRECTFSGHKATCSSLFKPIVTVFGKCCTFNMLPLGLLFKRANKTENGPTRDAIVEEQYFTKPEGIQSWSEWKPLKQRAAGLLHALSILIDSKLEDYYCPLVDFEGMRLHVHSAYEAPDMWGFSSLVPLGKHTHVRVNADITKADPDIRDYPQEKRNCYFENEKQLKFHRPYTRKNCIAECYGDYLARKCGCVRFVLPNYHEEHQEKKICSLEEHRCILQEQSNLYDNFEHFCPGCEPLCEDISYSYQVSAANLLSSPHSFSNFQNVTPGPRDTFVHVNVFFEHERSVPKLRKALYGWADLIANTGGILGLCLGFSVLSGIELVYFFTLRAFCNSAGHGSARGERRSMVTSLKRIVGLRTKVNNLPPDLQFTEEGMLKVGWM